ncbi:glycosyltransferase [Brevibacterium sp. 50QC2O2]|nr:glycosyltransferase [Brevibacterium sp. 50QC2O2]
MGRRIVIAIATFKRPRLLERLLYSVEVAVKNVLKVQVDICVVDNDLDQSAQQLCMNWSGGHIEYIAQPVPGIAATRNAAVEYANGSDFIVFLDDDEWVEPDWLVELLTAQEKTDADMVAGPVESVLDASIPDFIRSSGIFDRAQRENLSLLNEAGSGNLLCKYQVFCGRPREAWFQDAFGLTGGSDAELTRRLVSEGCRIIWAANAIATEEVPQSRGTISWLAKRYRRIGGVDFRLSTPTIFNRGRGVLLGVARVAAGAPVLAGSWVFGRGLNAAAFRRVFRGIGYMEGAVNGGYVEYKR